MCNTNKFALPCYICTCHQAASKFQSSEKENEFQKHVSQTCCIAFFFFTQCNRPPLLSSLPWHVAVIHPCWLSAQKQFTLHRHTSYGVQLCGSCDVVYAVMAWLGALQIVCAVIYNWHMDYLLITIWGVWGKSAASWLAAHQMLSFWSRVSTGVRSVSRGKSRNVKCKSSLTWTCSCFCLFFSTLSCIISMVNHELDKQTDGLLLSATSPKLWLNWLRYCVSEFILVSFYPLGKSGSPF